MQTKEKQNRIFVAFPGMGKTTYALSNAGVVDLDFGNFRSALKVAKEDEHTLFPSFQRLAKYYFKDGYDVLTNEPNLIPLLKQFAENRIVVVLPKNNAALVQRVQEREEKKHVNASFPIALAQNIDSWIDGWTKISDQYHVPIKCVDYFEEAL